MTERARVRLGGIMIALISLALVYSICKPTLPKPCGDVLAHADVRDYADVRGCDLTEGKTK